MNWSPSDIENVVREVLARIAQMDDRAAALVQTPSGVTCPAAQPAAPQQVTSEANPPVPSAPVPIVPVPSAPVAKTSLPKTDDLLTLRDRVVTLASLEGRTSAIRRVAVPRGAIVTPAVRDFLREKGLSLEFVAASQIVTGGPGGVRMTLVAMGTPFDPTPLVAMLQSDGLAVNDSKSDCLIESVGELAESVRSGALGLLLTKHVPAALCLANRREGVRAIAGGTAEETEKAARSVGANLLVVDPRRAGGLSRTKMLVRAFCSGGVRPCPDVFKSVLR